MDAFNAKCHNIELFYSTPQHMANTGDSDNSVKRPRGAMSPSQPATLDSIHEFLARLETKFDSKHETLDRQLQNIQNLLNQQLNTVVEEMDSKIARVSDDCVNRSEINAKKIAELDELVNSDTNAKKIAELDGLVKSLQGQLKETHEKSNRGSDIIMRGIPILEEENDDKLRETLLLLCKNISCNIDSSEVSKIFRLKSRETTNQSQPTPATPPRFPNIIVKFTSSEIKSKFMSAYFKIGSLSLTHAGFESTSRIYCNDNLTSANYRLFIKAMKLKGTKLHSVFSHQGIVFCRTAADTKPIKVTCDNDLDKLSTTHRNTNDATSSESSQKSPPVRQQPAKKRSKPHSRPGPKSRK